jgi:hypothetical protein
MTVAHRTLALLLAAAALGAAAPVAGAAPRSSGNKAFWGPTRVIGGESAFPLYREMGVEVFQIGLHWDGAAVTRPADPRDPADPAYAWPEEIDYALAEAARYDMDVLVLLVGVPRWANGGRDGRFAPDRVDDYVDYVTAATKRYPGVRFWQVWGEPNARRNFMPLKPARANKPLRVPLTRAQAAAPRRYARLLDAGYGALKAVDRGDVVIGGNTFTSGDILPLDWIRAMRLPNGRPPRMDMYGHNPFTNRKPKLSDGPLVPGVGYGDFSDLDLVAEWVDRYQRRPGGKRLKLFLAEFTLPTDHRPLSFNFWVTRRVQAQWITAALKITRAWRRIYALGWINLYDDAPNVGGNEFRGGLLDWQGRPKPGFGAFRRG